MMVPKVVAFYSIYINQLYFQLQEFGCVLISFERYQSVLISVPLLSVSPLLLEKIVLYSIQQ